MLKAFYGNVCLTGAHLAGENSPDTGLGNLRLNTSNYMKFKARVAVQRDGRVAYWTVAAIAKQMCLSGLAKRRGQIAIELPASNDSQEQDTQASMLLFAEVQPERHSYGAHTSVNVDRKTYAPCFFRAHTGQVGGTRRVYMENENEALPAAQTKRA